MLLVLGGWWIETSNLRMAGAAARLAQRIGAREARPGPSHREQQLCNIVDEVCIAAGMPRPQPMVLPREDAVKLKEAITRLEGSAYRIADAIYSAEAKS